MKPHFIREIFMGNRRFSLVWFDCFMSFVGSRYCHYWSMVVGFGFNVSNSFVILLTPINLSASLSVKGCKRI